MSLSNITIIIPIYNESKNIGLLIDAIVKNYKEINILIIDDFSTDDGIFIVQEKINLYGGHIICLYKKNNRKQKGLTNSILLGINLVDTEYFLVMDGDFQHPVKNIQNFINLFSISIDIVIGEREKIIFDEKKYRVYISQIGNYFINLKLKSVGFKFKDPLSGFFGGKTNVYKNIITNNKKIFLGKGYKFLFEFLKCIKQGEYNIQTFNFDFAKRKFGESKITFIIFIEFIKGFFK